MDRGSVHLALFHGSERSGLPETGDFQPHAPFDAEQIEASGLHHVLVGHYHRPRDAGRYTYPGNPEFLAFGEDGKRGAVILTVHPDGTIERERRVGTTDVHDLALSVTGHATEQAIRMQLARQVNGLHGVARVTVEGELDPHVDLHVEDLGLDRRTFLTVACVRQGDLLSVRANGRLLQEYIQRGAATGGADESAAAALERIAQYRREQVGASHRAAVGPLRRATVAVERARAALETARAEHASYCWLLTRQHELDDAEASAQATLYRTEVARTKVEASPPARVLQERADLARQHVEDVSARKPSQRLLLAALIAAIAGVAVAATIQLLIGISLLLIAGGLAILGVAHRDQQAITAALDTLRFAETAVASDREARIRAAHEAHTGALRGYEAAARAAAETRAQIAERTRGLVRVAAAEEARAAAEAERARVEALERTLALTQDFLMDAQERVHRSVAPVLGEQVSRWLPCVTSGRYAEALVDPFTLAVGVRAANGPWREAALLSHGTAEQVYLLLRLALADHLTRAGEVCPLILDEPTSHFDAERTEAMLDLLLEIASERQVIVFSQESEALHWAERRLYGPRHRLTRLGGPIALL